MTGCLLASLVFSPLASASSDLFGTGDGHAGLLSIPNSTSVVAANRFASLAADVKVGDTAITVDNAAGLCTKGDLVMLWQVAGFPAPVSGSQAAVDMSTSQAGRWELARIAAVDTMANKITLTAGFVAPFSGGVTQVVYIPEYTTFTLGTSSSVTTAPWNGQTGGITAMLVQGAITIGAGSSIQANGAGFRGGAFVNGNAAVNCSGNDEAGPGGANKGEGVAGAALTGRGNIANAAGGGVCLGSGGGGGGGGGPGGKGGYSNDGSRAVGGLGGSAVATSLMDHLVLGGGGGAGHGKNGAPTAGSPGGGVVFIRGASLVGTGVIAANGAVALSSSSDGGGGAGAGGSVSVRIVGTAFCTAIQVLGGIGGGAAFDFGPGGGGGGGHVLLQALSLNTCPVVLTTGFPGTQSDPNALGGLNFGASSGGIGVNEAPPLGGYCSTDGDCGGSTPACQPNGFCGECSLNNKTLCLPGGQKPVCALGTGKCGPCTMDAQCAAINAAKPVCETNNSAGLLGSCGQCGLSNETLCMGPAPICDTNAYVCKACGVDAECKAMNAALPACEGNGTCGQCSMSESSLCTGQAPACNQTAGVCALCVPDGMAGADASACAADKSGKVCESGTMSNVFCGCDSDADCGDANSGRVCDPMARKCADGCSPAVDRNHCPMGQFCSSKDMTGVILGLCSMTCVFDTDCPTGMPLCLKTSMPPMCVVCRSDADCANDPKGNKVCTDDTHTCVQCTQAKASACDPAKAGGACLSERICGCTTDGDCGKAGSGRICDKAAKLCQMGCRSDADCGAGFMCISMNNMAGKCAPAVHGADLGMSIPDLGTGGKDAGYSIVAGGGFCTIARHNVSKEGNRGGASMAWMLVAALTLVIIRRSGRKGRSAARRFLLVALMALAPAAEAQTAINKDFQLNRYQPTPAGEWTFAVEHPWYSSTRFFAAALTLDYSHNPLVSLRRDGAGSETTRDVLVGNQLAFHLDLAASLFDRLAINASVPMTLVETGTAGTAPMVGPITGTAVGDPRLGARIRLFGQPDRDKLSMHFGLQIWIPLRGLKSADDHAGDSSVRALPRITLAGLDEKLHIRWSTSAGFLFRGDGTPATDGMPAGYGVGGSELQLGAALGWSGQDSRFNLGPEVTFGTLLSNAFKRESQSLEALLGGSYNIGYTFQVGAAVGVGFWGIQGTPDFRGLLRIAYAPIRRDFLSRGLDSDGDGTLDAEDACPTIKGAASPDPLRNGCPSIASDWDHDGLIDLVDLCPRVPGGEHPDPTRLGCPAVDTDEDGVYDHEDLCPAVPAGARPNPTRAGCPAIDTDGDGVMDYEDQCPTVAAGLHPDAKKRGCAELDSDGDNVSDSVDACPSKAGAPDPDPRKNGCPGLVMVQNGAIVILAPVFFATGRDVILPKSFRVLKAVARALQATPEIKLLAVEGHTDNQGSREKNLELSDRRAKSVLLFLAREGIAEPRLTSQGYGPQRPIADNKSNRGRAANRRVEFRIVDPASPASATGPSPASATRPSPTVSK